MLECQSVRARDLSDASGGESGVRSRVRPGTPGDRCSAARLETGPGSWGSERDQWSEDPGVGETCCNVYTADTAVTTET